MLVPSIFPVGILKDIQTGRFHPIVFRLSPRPSSQIEDDFQRYKSVGHHTVGFETIEEAKQWADDNPNFRFMGLMWKWNSLEEEIPATVCDFSTSELEKKAVSIE